MAKKKRVCGVCDKPYGSGCTNNRCTGCHDKHCTPGGSIFPGHGLGSPPKK